MRTNPNAPAERGRPLDLEMTVSLSHLTHTLRVYRPIILLAMGGLAIVVAVVSVVLLLVSPPLKTTSIPFRLDFEGAGRARYPNDLRFSPDEIVSAPVLLAVFKSNQLDRFVDFASFSRALFVLESNPEYERLASEYQSRLADPKLSAVDRERVEKEFILRRDSLAKNEYALSFQWSKEGSGLPESLIDKVLGDTLTEWANYAVKEQRVLAYRISVLSPSVIDEASSAAGDHLSRIEVLRAKVNQVLDNISELEKVPGAELARASSGASLREIRMRLDEIMRFGLEPLGALVRNSGLSDPAATSRFLQTQLGFDQRRLQTAQSESQSIRQAIAVYFGERQGGAALSMGADAQKREPGSTGTETVMPQLSDSFLDRLVALTSRSTDEDYKRQLIKDYRDSVSRAIVIEQQVAYDRQVLSDLKDTGRAARADAATVDAEIAAARTEVRQLVTKLNEVYEAISSVNSPSKQLYTRTGTPVSRTERARSVRQLALYDFVILLLALPVIVLICLGHNRIREEQAEQMAATETVGPGRQPEMEMKVGGRN